MNKGDYVVSWLPTEENDDVYPLKNAVLITFGEGGYHQTDWKLSREAIVERNASSGITEKDRLKAECLAIHLSTQS